MPIQKKQSTVKETDKLPAKNRTSDDMALQRKYDKRKVDVPARFRFANKGNNPCTIMPDADISDIAFHNAKMFRAFGTTSGDLQQYFITQLASIFKGYPSPDNPDGEKLVTFCNMGIAILDEIRPRDIIEGMLAIQMTSVHNMAMDMMGRAMRTDPTSAGREAKVYQAMKLLRTFTMQMDSLKNYRRKGHQKVTVEHVNVNQGGQAIVGSVTQGGEGVAKKNRECTS